MSRAVIDHQHREDILAAAAIRAMLCASRGLSQSQACHPPGLDHCEEVLDMVGAEAAPTRPAASWAAQAAGVGAVSHGGAGA